MENTEHAPAASRGTVTLDKTEWAMLLASVLIAGAVCFGFTGLAWVPGIGVTGFVYACVGTALLSLRGRARYTRANTLLLSAGLLLAAVYGIYANEAMRLLNLPAVAATILPALYNMAGRQEYGLSCPAAFRDTALDIPRDAFLHMPRPFKALAGAGRNKTAGVKGMATGVLISLPLLAVVLALLSSSDAVFGAGLKGMLDGASIESLFPAARKATGTLLLGLLLFSLLYALRHPAGRQRTRRRLPRLPASSCAVVLAALNTVYAVFVYIQFAYFFGEAANAAMTGGWAQYARSGFFELVIITLINLSVFLLFLRVSDRHILLRWLGGLLLAMTGIILFSAARRMGLYIGRFGLSLLRLLTLWAMAVILTALALSAIRLFRAGFPLFPALLAFTLSAWLALNLSNPAARIAGWNSAAFLQGRLQAVDTGYLASLSVDTLPALRKLSLEGLPGAGEAVDTLQRQGSPPWYAWSLSCLQLEETVGNPSAGSVGK